MGEILDSQEVIQDGREAFQTEQVMPVVEVDTAAIVEAVVSVLDEREQQAVLMEAGELVPASEVTVISEVVQQILSYFQEDDNQILSDIRSGVTGIQEYLQNREVVNADLHLMMTTNFADYTVTEGLLLLTLLWLVIAFCVKRLKGAFSWLF